MKRCVVATMLIFALSLCLPFSAAAQDVPVANNPAASSGKTVTVGYIDYAGMIEQNSEGAYVGYGVDYMNKIAEITGWNVVYKHEQWSNLLGSVDDSGQRSSNLLSDGDVDFVLHAQKDDSRTQDFLYCSYPMGYESTVVYVRNDEDDIYYDDPQALAGLKVGVLNSSFQTDVFKSYAEANGITFQEVQFQTDAEQHDALASNQVDAIVCGSLAYYDEFKVVLKQGSDGFYPIAGKQNTELMSEMNAAMAQIMNDAPEFQSDLFERYYSTARSNSTPLFTREEAEYIKQAGTIRVGNLPARHPLSSVDENGNLTGVNEDILSEISRVSGLTFTYKALDVGQTTPEALASGDFDIIAGMMKSSMFTGNQDIAITTPFLESSVVSVVRDGESFDPNAETVKIAIPGSFRSLETKIKETHPNYEIRYYTTSTDCLQALKDKEVDLMMQNDYCIRYQLQIPRFSNMQIINSNNYDEESIIVGMKDQVDPRLFSVLNKSIRAIPTATTDQIVTAATLSSVYKYSAADFLDAYKSEILIASIALILLIFLALLVIVGKQRHATELEEKNRQLAESTQQAQSANSAKSDFLAQMSHEIRTPMNAIIGLTHIAKRDVGNPAKVTEDLTKIDHSSHMLLTLINDILDMTAIENKKMKIDSSPFDFRQLISSITTMYYSECRQRHIHFESRIFETIDEQMVGDSLRVNQILLNLLSNAVKFTHPGGLIELNIRKMREDDTTVFLRFTVKDTGEGMDEDLQKRLFKPFEQESASTARKHGGSGLGLSITKNLVEMMHGDISVKSTKGVGTTFTLDLPFGKIEQSPKMTAESIHAARAIVIDDDADTLTYTSDIFNRIGIRHSCFEDGEKALDAMGEADENGDPFTLCFIDWKMPTISGEDVTKTIRQAFGDDAIIIIVSAYDLDEIESAGRNAGANYFLAKPLFQSSIYDMLTAINSGGYVKDTAESDEYDFAGTRVLLAEDVVLNMEVAVQLLKMVGADCECAEDGAEAVKMFADSAEGYYDLILMDINMPELNGYEATEQIRMLARPDAKDIPILAMTANAFTDDIAKSLNSGMDGHIAKPIDTEILYATMREVLKKND